MNSVTLAVPTWNNPHQLQDTLVSLARNTDFAGRIIVVNNGQEKVGGTSLYDWIQAAVPYDLDWIEAGENLGWAGGINEALKHADTELFGMLNDDVLFPPASFYFWRNLLNWFHISKVGGVGPTSNYACGHQNAFVHGAHPVLSVGILVGFCAVYRRKVLDGGLDTSLPGGDDFDLSIRVRNQGFDLVADRRCYLHHHGSQTGRKLHPGYWDSANHQAATYNALIRKHGLRKWFEAVNFQPTAEYNLTLFETEAFSPALHARIHGDPLENAYWQLVSTPSDINLHLPVLYRYASSCRHVTEFGTNDCTSTTALLYARPAALHSYDIQKMAEVDALGQMAGETAFLFHHQHTLAAPIETTDLLFIDDEHSHEQVKAELELHANQVRRYIFFHDIALHVNGAGNGVWRAISEFLRQRREWRICHLDERQNGLLGIERVGLGE